MIELTTNMRQKDDQPFTELLNRFRTASQIEGDIQCIQSRLVSVLEILTTQYCIFGTVFFLYFLFIFHIPKFFSNNIFFSGGSIAL